MLKLHGILGSNYYGLTKAALLEKGLEFEEVNSPPSQESDYLQKSPMGKVPALETEDGFISESYAIIDYLERVQPEPALLPHDAFKRAKSIELSRHLELDVELVARRCLFAAFYGGKASDETRKRTQKDLVKGVKAVGILTKCEPFIMGSEFTLTDLTAYFTFGLAGDIAKKMFDIDILDEQPEIKDLMSMLANRESIKRVAADQAN